MLPAAPTEAVAMPARIDAIEVSGLTRTKPEVVLRELPFVPGDVVSQDDWEFAELRLWNLNIFATVATSAVRDLRTGKVTCHVDLTERWTLIPLFSFGAGGGVQFVQAGITDTNLLGRMITLGLKYERFAVFDGFQAWLRDPRLLNSHWDGLLMVEQLVRPRPDYGDRRLRLATELAWLGWREQLRLAGRLSVQRNTTIPRDGSDPGPDAPHLWSKSLELGVRVGRVDTVKLRSGGASIEARTSINAYDPEFANRYMMLWVEAQGYWMPGERWNFTTRLQGAIQGTVPIPLRFYIGGLELTRGYPDSYVRTDRYAVLNSEARFIAFESEWLALMPAVFVDAGVVRRETGGPEAMLSAGGGVRILIPKLVESGIRIDWATPLLPGLCPDNCSYLSIGVYQFFDPILTPERR